MSQDYSGEDPTILAKRAERDLNSYEAKTGHEKSSTGIQCYPKNSFPITLTLSRLITLSSPTATESGVDATAENKFPGSQVTYGSAASGAGDNREIPSEEGGAQQRGTGRMTKAGDFDQGEAGEGPEDVARRREEDDSEAGSDTVRGNVGNESIGEKMQMKREGGDEVEIGRGPVTARK